MPSFYVEMQELANELLTADDDNFGQSKTGNVIEIHRRSEVAGATDLDEPAITWTAETVKAVSRGVDAKRDGESLAQKSDKLVTIYAKDVTIPALKDQIAIDSVRYSIVSVEESSNDGDVAVYFVYVKR